MTVTAERIEFLTCWSDDSLVMMVNGGYRDDQDELHTATLEELQAVYAYRAEKDAEWIRSLDPFDRDNYVESGELDAEEVAKAMGVLSLVKVPANSLHVTNPKLTLAKRAATRPVLVAHHEITGAVINVGDRVVSFRGEPAILVSLDRPKGNGRDGKVTVKWEGFDGSKRDGFEGSYYAGVFDILVSEAK